MQRQINGFYVAPDGTCFTNSGWDESGQDAGIYKDGDFVGRLPGIHDRITYGGWAVVGDGKYVYYSAHRDPKGQSARTWLIGRSTLDAKPVAWPQSEDHFIKLWTSPKESVPAGGAVGEVFSIAVSDGELFIGTVAPDKVVVFDKSTGQKKREFEFARPGAMAFGPDRSLWIVQRSDKPANRIETEDSGADFRVLQYTPEGAPTGKRIMGGRPQALNFEGSGRLMIADDGPRQQIVIYDVSAAEPKEVGAIGERGGILAEPPGHMGPSRLPYPCGVGIDARGNAYISSRLPVTGAQIVKLNPQAEQQWQLFSNQFMNCSDADPASDGAMVYSPRECFAMDFTKSNGKEATWVGHTVDKFRFPDDPRLHGEGSMGYAPMIRRIQGKLFMYLLGERGRVAIFKQVPDSFIFAPCGFYSTGPIDLTKSHGWPAAQPKAGRWLWIDRNGDGRIDQAEIENDDKVMESGWTFCVDKAGDIWHADRLAVMHYPLLSLDAHGNPLYDFASAKRITAPDPFPQSPPTDGLIHSIQRLEYDRDADVMYIAGFTAGDRGIKNTRGAIRVTLLGNEVFCYEHWSGENRKLKWRIPVVFNIKDLTACANAMSFANGRLYVGAVGGAETQNKIWAYDCNTGREMGLITPGPEVGAFGWIDFTHGLRAFGQNAGQTLLFVEDVWKEKQVMYRISPGTAGN